MSRFTPKRPVLVGLVLLFPRFLTAALARQSFLHALSFTGLQIKRVTFYFLDDVLGLHLPLETAKSVLEGLTLLKSDFSQSNCTPLLVLTGPNKLWQALPGKSSGMCRNFRLLRLSADLGTSWHTLAPSRLRKRAYSLDQMTIVREFYGAWSSLWPRGIVQLRPVSLGTWWFAAVTLWTAKPLTHCFS